MAALEFRIMYPDGKQERLAIDSDRVLIGSGAHCEIRLPPEQAAVEHVLITFLGGAVYVNARWYEPPPTINGAPFTQAPLLPDSVLTVGHIQIAIRIIDVAEGPGVIQKKEQRVSPATLIFAALVLPASILMLLSGDDRYPVGDIPDPPGLWSGEPITVCPQQARDLASSLARDRKIFSEAKRERCPFEVKDCVEAVPAFETSASCFKQAGDDEMSKEMLASASSMREQVNETYRGHQMRLEHTLTVGDLRTAQKQVKVLLRMLEGQNTPYVTWLSNHDRRLALRLGKAKDGK